MLVSTLLMTTSSFAASDAPTQDPPTKIKFEVVLQGVVPSDATPAFIEQMKSRGWNINGNSMTKRIAGGKRHVLVEGKSLETDFNGVVEIPMSQAEEIIEVKDEHAKKVRVKKGQVTRVEEIVDFHKALAGMGGQPASTEKKGHVSSHPFVWPSEGVRPPEGGDVHCNRFNGYQGDGHYHAAEYQLHTIENFNYSDCSLAWEAFQRTPCQKDSLEYSVDGTYCAGGDPEYKNGRCSLYADIDNSKSHYRRFHMHTSMYGPSGY